MKAKMFITALAVMISDKKKPTDVDEALRDIARHGISTIPVPRQVRPVHFDRRSILSFFLKNIVPSIVDMRLESFTEW